MNLVPEGIEGTGHEFHQNQILSNLVIYNSFKSSTRFSSLIRAIAKLLRS